MTTNPFPGPQPYRAADRARFFGREDMAHQLRETILANRSVTVYGPSGAGKSSVLQAAVLPALIEKHDIRLVRLDAWPEGEEPTKWLAQTVHSELRLGDLPADAVPKDAVFRAARGAARSSSRLLVIYLDQLEQLLFSGRTIEETQPFFDCVEELLGLPLRNVRVVLSLREDYLGRFRDRLRDLRHITENGFRVGPMTVQELTESVILAAASGEPRQTWSADEMRGLMLQVRVPGQAATDEAEAQSAYAQIICRALFQERAAGKTVAMTEAEPILQGYLESTVADLGPLRDKAQELLADHLVGLDGSRTLRTEKELGRVVAQPDLGVILKQLEGAAILRAEEHQGSRYFEIGHDWLARKVFEQREERVRVAEQKRLKEEQARQLENARVQQRKLRRIAAGALVIAALVGGAAVVAFIARSQAMTARTAADEARVVAENAEKKAAWERDEANDLRVMAGYLALRNQGDPTSAMKLLSEVKKPAERSEWILYANEALETSALFVTLRGHRLALRTAAFSSDGNRVLTASEDGTARIWNANGTGVPVVLAGHSRGIVSAAFAPGKEADKLRVLTTSLDGTARVWNVQGTEQKSIVLGGESSSEASKTTEASCGAWSPDGQRVAVALVVTENGDPNKPALKPKETIVVRVYAAGDGTLLGEYAEHRARVNAVVFLDDTHVITASDDKTARVWDGVTRGKVTNLPGHLAPVLFVAADVIQGIVVTTSTDAKVRVFKVGPNVTMKPYATLVGHTGDVVHAAISADGKFVATASVDRTARVWNIEQPIQKAKKIVLSKHDGPVAFVAFRPTDARFVATAAADHVGRVFRVDIPDEPLVLSGHASPLRSIAWNSAGDRLITAAADTSQSASADHTAKIWNAAALTRMVAPVQNGNGASGKGPFHVAAFADQQAVFAVAYGDTTVELRDERKETTVASFKAPANEAWGFVSGVAPTADGERVAIASRGVDAGAGTPNAAGPQSARGLFVFQKSSPEKPIKRWEPPAAIRSVAWNKAGDRIAAGLEDSTVMLFRSGNDDPPMVLRGHTAWVTSAAFSTDGQQVVTTSLDKTALVFDANRGGAPIARFEHPAAVYSAAFDPSGKRMATGCADGKVRIFHIAGDVPPVELEGKGAPRNRIIWSADGTRIAAASSMGTILVWSPITWPHVDEIRPFVLGTPRPPSAITFAAGGKLIAAAENRSFVWRLDIEELMTALREANRDCLSVENRVLSFRETLADATAGFATCELSYQRTASGTGTPPTAPVDQANSLVTTVVVLPVDAEIEVNGTPLARRDGLIELRGKAGDSKTLHIIHGSNSIDVPVTIDASGAKPSLVDFDAIVGAGSKGPKKPGGGNLDSLISPVMQ